jgi:hypothetical protein
VDKELLKSTRLNGRTYRGMSYQKLAAQRLFEGLSEILFAWISFSCVRDDAGVALRRKLRRNVSTKDNSNSTMRHLVSGPSKLSIRAIGHGQVLIECRNVFEVLFHIQVSQ